MPIWTQEHLAALAAEKLALFRGLVESSECTFRPDLNRSQGGNTGGQWP